MVLNPFIRTNSRTIVHPGIESTVPEVETGDVLSKSPLMKVATTSTEGAVVLGAEEIVGAEDGATEGASVEIVGTTEGAAEDIVGAEEIVGAIEATSLQ